MIIYAALLVVIFIVCTVILLTLRLNKFQLKELLFYQYNYIPEPLLSVVKVHSLKNDMLI
ncbi:PIF-7 [Mythimna sequax nucleopolyhedrovirus]|nr:PIF-7 [Mythimna sequax nucleopolyhedrovirus]